MDRGDSATGLLRLAADGLLHYTPGMVDAFERYAGTVAEAFGDGTEPIEIVARRAEALFGDARIIVWEGDAQTFEFSFVSASAEEVLAHPVARWTTEATFWADHVVHPDDRDEAIAYCALATGKGVDHAFVYRAKAADGTTVPLLDYVQVIKSKRGIAERLRGIMIDVSDAEQAEASQANWQSPPRRTLEARR